PRIGVALDLFGDGRTALKGSVARYVNGQNIAVADDINPVSALSITDRRPWTNDLDGNGLPLDANGNVQFNELGTSTATPTFGRSVSTTSYDPSVLNGWYKRAYNLEYTVAVQHELAPRMSVSGSWFRRSFGNQTFTDDVRFDRSSYDGPFCVTAPADARLPGGGGYQVCNLFDLKPSVFALGLPANNVVKFSESVASANFANPAVSTLGRALNPGAANKTIQLIREGLEYGDQNLHQLDLRASKRFRFAQYRVRFDFDLYNVFSSNWPYTVNNTFSNTAASAWLRPTNVLQSRFFKIGAQFDF